MGQTHENIALRSRGLVYFCSNIANLERGHKKMKNSEYFDLFIEQEKDFKDLPIGEQLKLFRGCSPFIIEDIINQFGDEFVNNCIKAHILTYNTIDNGTFFVNWDRLKKFEEFIKETDEKANLF